MSWQSEFDRWFPLGANVAGFISDPEEPEASQFICPRVMVEEEEPLVLRLVDLSSEKTAYVEVRNVADYDALDTRYVDKLVWPKEPEATTWRITDRLSDAARNFCAQAKKDYPWIFSDQPHSGRSQEGE